MRCSGLPSLEPTEHLQDVVLCVSRQSVAPDVHSDAGTSRYAVVKLDVRRLRLVELHVPVTVRRDFVVQLLAEYYLRKRCSIRREGPRRLFASCCLEHLYRIRAVRCFNVVKM